MLRLFTLAAAAIAFSPAETARAGETAGPVLEIVEFRLRPGSDEPAFLDAARRTEAMLRADGNLVRRVLVRDADDLWTDIIEWTSHEAALSAAGAAMRHPDFAPFGAMIDPATVRMRHAAIRWRMD